VSERRRTVGVPMLARPRRPCLPLDVRREHALREAVVWLVDIVMVVVVAGLTEQALVLLWWSR